MRIKLKAGQAIVSLLVVMLWCDAFALDRGECGTPEAMSAKLKAEDQHSFGSADRIVREKDINSLYGMIFTVSSDKSVGYILQSDKPTEERAGKICVHERLADLTVFDAGKPGVPKEALLKASDEDAKRLCEKLIKDEKVKAGTCGTLNESLRKSEAASERVMFHGFNVSKQKNGNYAKDGTLTTVTATLQGKTTPLYGTVFLTSLPQGATTYSVILAYPEYTPYGLTLIGRK
ncbi:MAG: hypothetical protein QM808_17720 [Steroidobacteraceae bacterium]